MLGLAIASTNALDQANDQNMTIVVPAAERDDTSERVGTASVAEADVSVRSFKTR